jgi:radical SAM superfamily enzyme
LSWLKTKKINITAMNCIVPKIHTITQRLLKESGFQRINISLVNANESIQKDINRAQFKDFNIILDKFIETNITIETHFIIGLPQQNLEHIIKTIIYLSEKKVLLGPSIFYLSPESRAFYDYLNKL